MDQHDDTASSIVIIEAGAGWPSWITEYQRRAPNAAVVAQIATDSFGEFRERVAHRVQDLSRPPHALRVGIFVCSEDGEPGLAERRREIGRVVVSALTDGGDLVFAANESCAEGFKHELLALAGELCDQRAPECHLNVRVRFSSSQSGTMPSVVPAAPPSNRDAAGNE